LLHCFKPRINADDTDQQIDRIRVHPCKSAANTSRIWTCG
jgi:hypothetical protein